MIRCSPSVCLLENIPFCCDTTEACCDTQRLSFFRQNVLYYIPPKSPEVISNKTLLLVVENRISEEVSGCLVIVHVWEMPFAVIAWWETVLGDGCIPTPRYNYSLWPFVFTLASKVFYQGGCRDEHKSVYDECLQVCICTDMAFHFHCCIWFGSSARLLWALVTIAFLLCFPPPCYKHPSSSRLTLFSTCPILFPFPAPPRYSSSADTHEQPSRTRLCIAQPSSTCRCVGVLDCVCTCVFGSALSGDTTGSKLEQFVKSREVWASRSNLV